MKCFVINLKRAVERKQYISNQLHQFSQEFEFFEGVDWKDIDPDSLTQTVSHIKIKNSYRALTLGQMGCNLSHRYVLKWLVDSSERMITILEDDVRLSNDFPDVLDVIESTTKHFDIVFLGSRFTEDGLVNLVPLNDKFNFSLSKAREKGGWGYVITRKAAKKFLRILPEVTGPIDDALHAYYLHGLNTYTLNPQIVFHEEEAKRFSFNTETKIERFALKEELMRFASMFYEYYAHKTCFSKRVKAEKI
ncbi:MAG: glycosyltransferase family 25 protein [Rhodobacteraceae bacterium]|nr:glycosyltransferase family 25 protein [Paracoccaceae bacterium]